MKRLIVTADDVGLHHGMTEGALRAHRDGIVTACSVVANGAAFEDAMQRLRDVPALAVGVHLALVDEKPLAPDAQSLIGSDGRMHRGYGAFVPRYAARAIRMADVERELRAQIEAVLRSGAAVTHANGHQHLHLLPRIFDVVQRLVAEYGIGYVRIVDDRGGRAGFARGASIAALGVLGRRARKRSAVRTNDATIGVAEAGHLSAESIIRLLDSIEGTTELVVHPGLGRDALSAAYSWRYEWDGETAALCEPAVREAIRTRGIVLTTPT